jgi:Leucine-rich repeat (LRR) protein
LSLSYNQISVIPDAIASLTNLQILNLSYNQISVIPDANDIAKRSEDPKKKFVEMMQEREYNQNVIDLWSSEM